MRVPAHPENIRLVHHDTDEVVPLDSVFVGTRSDGINIWAVTLTLGGRHHAALLEGRAHMALDKLPGHTEVIVRFEGD